MNDDIFVKYSTPEAAAEAFYKMLHAKDEWRAQVREAEQKAGLSV